MSPIRGKAKSCCRGEREIKRNLNLKDLSRIALDLFGRT